MTIYNVPISYNFLQKLSEIVPNHATIIMPSRRICFNFRKYAKGKRLEIISSEDLEQFIPSIPPAISIIKRKFILNKIIARYSDQNLANEYISLINDIFKYEIENLDELDFSEYATHIQNFTLSTRKIIADYKLFLESNNLIDPIIRRNLIISQYAKYIPQDKEIYYVYLPGGSRAEIKLLNAMKNHHIILYGVDLEIDFDEVSDAHPQFLFKELFKELNLQKKDIISYEDNNPIRSTFIKDVMLPANLASQARTADPQILEDIKYLIFTSLKEEGEFIAKKLIEAKNACLITNNYDLKKIVTMNLRGEQYEDSFAINLRRTPIGEYFLNIATMVKENLAPIPLLSVLKNEFTKFDIEEIYKFELELLRSNKNIENITDIIAESTQFPEREGFIKTILANASGLIEVQNLYLSFCDFLNAHINVFKNFIECEIDPDFTKFLESAGSEINDSTKISYNNYIEIINDLLNDAQIIPSPKNADIGVFPLLDARLINYDLVIISSLNEGEWPNNFEHLPWLSKILKSKIGLPTYDRTLALSAYDFYQHAHHNKLIFTRANYINGEIKFPCRFLARVMFHVEQISQGFCNIIKNEKEVSIKQQVPVAPTPPAYARPTSFSVGEIKKLINDPYYIYVKKILQLEPLPPIKQEFNRGNFGNIIHNILAKFINAKNKSYDELIKIGKVYFKHLEKVDQAIYWPKFQEITKFVIEENLINSGANFKANLKKEYIVEVEGVKYTICGKFDLIDDNNITDYRTSTNPSLKNIKEGLTPEMGLLALIAKENDGNAKLNLRYVQLKGAKELNEVTEFKADFVEEFKTELYNLLVNYSKESTPYLSYPNNEEESHSEYSHLARNDEWR